MKNKFYSLEQLFLMLESSPTKIIFEQGEKKYSAKQLLSDIAYCHKKLPEDCSRIALCFTDHYFFTVALLTVLYKDFVPVLLPNNQPGTLQNLAAEYDAILTDATFNTQKNTDIAVLPARILSSDQRMIFFTSGSTGEPKKISRTLLQLSCELQALEKLFGAKMHGSVFSTVLHQHLYGLLFYILWPLCSTRVINLASLNYPEQIANISARDFILISSPALLKRIGDCSVHANNVTIFSSGGLLKSSVAKSVYAQFKVYSIEIFGSTETSAVAWRTQENSSCWKIFPSVALEINFETQCLMVTQSAFFECKDAFLMSDMARFNNDGSFEFLGRADRVVKIEEKRISLPEIENILENNNYVEQAYALKLEDNRQYIAVVVVLTAVGREVLKANGKRDLNHTLKTALFSHIEAMLLPKKFRYVDEIPTNAQGKYIPAMIEKLFENDIKLPEILKSTLSYDHSECVLQLHIPQALIYFVGHFSGMPILPGVVQIDWAIHFSAQFMGILKKNIGNISPVKFTKTILPDTTLSLFLKREENKIKFRYFDDVSVYSSGTFHV